MRAEVIDGTAASRQNKSEGCNSFYLSSFVRRKHEMNSNGEMAQTYECPSWKNSTPKKCPNNLLFWFGSNAGHEPSRLATDNPTNTSGLS
jgi:hypothetical protein